ncbi:MAG: hypothetical protein K2I75_06285 [Clostridiales bacterium]|nr:hypothetical protein [Clostridiales bacterium]
MSQKRVKRDNKSQNKPILKNTLEVQKNSIKRVTLDYFGVALLFLCLSVIVLVVALVLDDKAHANRILYIALPILSVFTIIFLFLTIKRFMLLHTINRVRYENEETVNIECANVRFISHAIVRGFSEIKVIVFVDLNNKKYVYILPNNICNSKDARSNIRLKCKGQSIELVCYKSTRMVKYFNPDK